MAPVDQKQPAPDAPLHVAIVMDGNGRWAKRRGLPRQVGHPKGVDAIRQATNGNFALGDSRFGEQIAQALGRRVQPGKSGRPRKVREAESEALHKE